MTPEDWKALIEKLISTHTLTWSVTFQRNQEILPKLHFNSHAHVERDLARAFINPMFNGISTHTLTWSVTLDAMWNFLKLRISTHTLTWSVTQWVLPAWQNFSISTHTLTWSVTIALAL